MKALEKIFDLVAPYECLVCQGEGQVLCEKCAADNIQPIPSRCYRCKKLTSDFAVCPSCRTYSKLNNVWVRSEYVGVTKELVHEMKYKSNRQAAKLIAELLREMLPILQDLTVVNIPTATGRVRQRGYDHTKVMANELARLCSLPHQNAMARTGQTRQVGSNRETRLNQLEDSFIVKKQVEGQKILLVDDITTTGATLESAATELRKLGAQKVYAVAFAQK